MTPLDIEVFKGETRRYRAILYRADGVEVELDGGAYNRLGDREVPHDIAHLIVEDELGLDRGVWGVLAAGGFFRGASVRGGGDSGRMRRGGAARSSPPRRSSSTRPRCSSAPCVTPPAPAASTCARTRASAGGPRRLTEAAVARAHERLGAAARDWAVLEPGGSLRFTWPGRTSKAAG